MEGKKKVHHMIPLSSASSYFEEGGLEHFGIFRVGHLANTRCAVKRTIIFDDEYHAHANCKFSV